MCCDGTRDQAGSLVPDLAARPWCCGVFPDGGLRSPVFALRPMARSASLVLQLQAGGVDAAPAERLSGWLSNLLHLHLPACRCTPVAGRIRGRSTAWKPLPVQHTAGAAREPGACSGPLQAGPWQGSAAARVRRCELSRTRHSVRRARVPQREHARHAATLPAETACRAWQLSNGCSRTPAHAAGRP